MKDKRELEGITKSLLSADIDILLQDVGFARRGNGLRYARKCGAVTSAIQFKVFVRPSYASPDSHLSVDYVLSSPEIMSLAQRMAPLGTGLNSGDVLLRRPIDWLRPPGAPLWKFHDESSLRRWSEAIARDITDYVKPYAARLASIDDYVAAQLKMFAEVEQSRSPEIYSLAAAILLSSESDSLAVQLLHRFLGPSEADRIFDTGCRARGH